MFAAEMEEGDNDLMGLLARSWGLLIDLVLPGGCAGCNGPLGTGEGPWCVECGTEMGRAAQAPYCPRCGLTIRETPSAADGCVRCRNSNLRIDGLARTGEYAGLLRETIVRYKFGGDQRLDWALGRHLAAVIQAQPWACELDALVPVPISWRSRARYRFSPTDAVARQARRELGLPVLPLLYERGKRRRQVGLLPVQRRENVRGAFWLRRASRPAGGIFCVIDDVSTTGSTLEEIARVLKQAGAIRVYAAVLAKTDPDRASESMG